MTHMLSFLRDNYEITVENNLVNCTELIEVFELDDVDISEYKSKTKIDGDIYINKSDCLKFVLNNNIKELLFLIDTKFQCDKCHKIFSSKRNLQSHNETQKNCSDKKYSCLECNKNYASRTTLLRHQKTQKHIKATSFINTDIQGNNNSVNNSKNKTINKTINNNIIIVMPKNDFYDVELWNKLSTEEQLNILSGSDYIQNLVKAVHFNKDKPESHNVISENMRDKRGAIYANGEWKSKNLVKIATELMENRTNDIKLILEKHKLSLSPEVIEKVNNCLKRIISVPEEEIAEHVKKVAELPPIEALELSNKLGERINKIDKNKKELQEEIQMIIYDYTKSLKLKRN